MLKTAEIVQKLQVCNLREVARQTGLSYQTVRNVAAGCTMSIKTYEKLAELLGVK